MMWNEMIVILFLIRGLTELLCIQDVLGSNLGLNISFSDFDIFLWFFLLNLRMWEFYTSINITATSCISFLNHDGVWYKKIPKAYI